MNTPLDSFESALLTRLRDHVEGQSPERPRFSPRRLLAAGAVSAATAAAALVVVPGLGPTPAYSVQEGNAGTITVEVRRLEDAEGLETELAKYGVDADITYLPEQQECAPGRYPPVARSLAGMQVSLGTDLLRVTLPPGAVRDGETFVMAVSGAAIPPAADDTPGGITHLDGISTWTDFDVTAGPIGACQAISSLTG